MSRRVISGLDTMGKSAVMVDESVAEGRVTTLWYTETVPADNSAQTDSAPTYTTEMLHADGSLFIMVRMPPGMHAFWHATDTIDYVTMISGSVTLELESGEVTLHAGDVCVDRGVLHSWRNDGAETAIYTCVVLPAQPVGNGRTI